ncbi:MAG: flagellar filament capping protein FliD [Nitrospirales bacterium]
MPLISFGGLGNGVDFGPIIDLLVQAERIPIDRINKRKLDLQTKQTDFGLLGGKLLGLQSAATSLRTRLSFDKNQVSVTSASSQTLLTASASSTAAAGTHKVTVNQLASAHQIVSKASTAVSTTDTDIVSGESGTFSFSVGGGSTHTVNLDANGTLEALRDGINDLGAGVSASILNTGTEAAPAYRLVLSSNDSGASNSIVISADNTDVDAVTTGVDTFQVAQDSQITLGEGVGAVTIDRSSNTLTDVISGITLNLQAADIGNPVTISVTQDTTAVKEGISNFVSAYNEVQKFVNERTVFNLETGERGIFVGDSLARSVLDRIRQSTFSQISGLTTYTSASQIGFETQTADGTIKLNEAILDGALSQNYSAVRDLFVRNPTTGTEGIGELVTDAVDALDDVEFGALTLRQNALTSQIDDFVEQISFKEAALLRFEEQQRIKFGNLDGLLASLQSQLDSLSTLSQRAPTR